MVDKPGLEANQVSVVGERDLVVDEPWEEPFPPPRTCSGLGDDLGLKLIRFRLQENGIS